MVSDRAWSQAVLAAKSAASLHCFLLTKPRRKSICGARIHAFMEYAHEHSLTPSRWSKLRCTRAHTHTHKHAHERTRRTVLSPWLSRAICLSPPSPLTAAACPGQLRASQKSPSAIQQHINLLKSQPFQKGRRHSNLSAVVRGNIISLSQIHDSVTSALDDMKSEGGGGRGECIFLSPHILLFLSTYLMSLGAFSKSYSLSLSIVSYLYEHSGLSERAVSGAAARAGPEERLERYRLMAQETA